MNLAVPYAKQNPGSTYACVVGPRGTKISVGYNQYKTHPLQAKFASNPQRIFLHAEIDAIVKALKHITPTALAQCSIHVARFKNYPKLGMVGPGLSQPCTGCAGALAAFGIKDIVFTENLNG